MAEIKKYVINPVEAREASLETKATLKMEYPMPTAVATLEGFNELDEEGLKKFIDEKGLAMDLGDIKFCQEYFRSEHRDPTITEIKMIDTYWSDHCRHTTFGTILDDVQIDDAVVQEAFDRYMAMRTELGRENKPRCMMDLATIGAKELKKQGILKNLDESEEINACTVKIKCDVNGKDEDWLFLFKNETHNHPPRSSPSAVLPPVSAVLSATRCPAAATSIRLCVSPAQATRSSRSARPCPASCPSASWSPPQPPVTPPTATRSVWLPVRWTRSTTPAMWQSAWRSALLWALPLLPTSAASAPLPAM